MKLARYHELLGRMMDGELSGTEDEELGRALKDFPALREDLRQHLVLWEIWSQDQSPERSAQGFVHAWETRLSAEGESAEAFTAAVRSQLENSDRRGCPEEAHREGRRWNAIGLRMALWFEGLRIFSQRPAKLFWVLSAAMVVVVSAWFATTRSTHAATTIQGEGICTLCTLKQGHEHLQAIRVIRPAAGTHLYYLEKNRISAGVDFCDGPLPVVGKGYLKTNEARVSLEATELKVQRR
jgi:hypothetical protein